MLYKFTSMYAARRDRRSVLGRWLPWLKKGTLAVVDQGLVSGCNFLLSVLLARWLLPEEYGAYALSFSVFLLLAGFHQNLLLSPLSVLGPSVYRHQLRNYLGAMLWIQAAFGIVVSAALAIAAWVAQRILHQPFISNALAGLAISAPCVLLFWLARGAHYLELSPGPAARSSALYSVCLLTGLTVLHRYGSLSPFSVFVLMGIGSLVVSYSLLNKLKPVIRPSQRLDLRSVCGQHWNYGRWELGTGIVYWIGENISMLFTGVLLGVGEVGSLKALMNLALPPSHVVVAMGRLTQPHTSRVFEEAGPSAAAVSVRTMARLFLIGGLAFFAVVALFYAPLFRLLYGGKFMQYAHLAWIVALGLVFQAVYQAYAVGLRALRSPSSLFFAYLAATLVSVTVGIPLIRHFGLAGMIAASTVSGFAALVAGVFLFRYKLRSLTKRVEDFDPQPPEFIATPSLKI